ncbi:hypothetical protein CK516_20450, partial [Nostoc sp. 'Peltigera malacea cyanobiont' DB3992]
MLQCAVTSMKTSAMCDFSQVKGGNSIVMNNRPLAKVPNTPPPTPKRSSGGEKKLRFGSLGVLIFYLYKRSNVVTLQY